MNIAILAWGSLVWDPRSLATRGEWSADGPELPIEFARISSAGRLTLVIWPEGSPCRTYWIQSARANLDQAIKNLSDRECAASNSIGWLTRNASCLMTTPSIDTVIRAWLEDKSNLDAVIWTDLDSNFRKKTRRDFSVDIGVQYLQEILQRGAAAEAETYIRRAPPQTKTALRQRAREVLGWTDMVPPQFVIHIRFDFIKGMFNPLRIWTALRRAQETGKLTAKRHEELLANLGETAIYLAGRQYILETSVTELRKSLARFTELVPEPWKLEEIDDGGVRYRIIGSPDIYRERDRVLLSVEAFLYEFKAYLDLLAKFVHEVLVGIGQAPRKRTRLRSVKRTVVISDRRNKLRSYDFLLYMCDVLHLPIGWFEFLSRHRNFFTHEASPYIALEDRLARPPEFEFIIMRKNIHDFAKANPDEYFRLSDCQEVVRRVVQFSQRSEEHLVHLLES